MGRHGNLTGFENLKELDANLIRECNSKKALNHKLILDLLKQGADAATEFESSGTWGEQDKYSAIHGLLENRHWKERKSASIALKIAKELFKHGAKPNAEKVKTNWKGSGSQTSAFEMAFQLVVKDDNNGTSDLREKLLGLFLKNGANPFDMKVRHIETMRSSGTKIAPVWHAAVERGKFQITKAILENASNPDIDQESTGFVSNERGYDEDYVQTALHITCTLKSHIDAFQILYCLLSSGANPNRFEIKLETRNRPDLSFEDDDGLDDPRSPGYQPSVESFRTITSPIHLALKNGNIPAVWLLTKFGADSSNPSIDCPRNQFPKKNFGRSSKDIELGSGSLEKYFDDFVKEKPDYAITTEKFLEMLEIENIDDMQLALTGELPGKYESFVTPDMNM